MQLIRNILVATSLVVPARSIRMAATERITSIVPSNFKRVPLSSLDAAFAIEEASYPEDEAATREKLKLRIEEAGGYFWGVSGEGGELQGFMCGTLTKGDALTEESMSVHEPDGTTLCIHSVVVREADRWRGLGGAMLKAYVAQVAGHSPVTSILLMCKKPLIEFYSAAGFELLGQSPVVHGADPWFDMKLVTR